MKIKDKHLVRSLIMVFVSIIIVTVTGIFYTGYSIRKNNQKWCEFLITMDEAYESIPPTSDLGKKIFRSFHELKINYEC